MKKYFIGIGACIVSSALMLNAQQTAGSASAGASGGAGVSGSSGISSSDQTAASGTTVSGSTAQTGALPPGLQKRDQLPPGLQNRSQLPPGLAMRTNQYGVGSSNQFGSISGATNRFGAGVSSSNQFGSVNGQLGTNHFGINAGTNASGLAPTGRATNRVYGTGAAQPGRPQ